MADQNYKVAYRCNYCGRSFHEVDDHHSMASMPVYVDYDGRQYCTEFCRNKGYEFYNS
ncbi:hypothetical protein [Desulfosarcina variabilis]|uniref:hypothetical protein n=1 Tax=Desulfosarcina variabilis TaxID=2300 RepID=UPI003AFAACA8